MVSMSLVKTRKGSFNLALLLLLGMFFMACRTEAPKEVIVENRSILEQYVDDRDTSTPWEVVSRISGEGQTTYIIKMESQNWLSTKEVKDPLWWHWLKVIVPAEVEHSTGMLFIGGGSRKSKQPTSATEEFVQTAILTKSIVAELHNVPNQPVEFVGDDYGPRVEDELIAYGWRKFLEGGAKDEDVKWLARTGMTTAAARAMDILQEFSWGELQKALDGFVVAGASKRGWTTWTTGAVDDRVVAIVPIVIDVLNVVPSFEHHWRAYGNWAPAVGNYKHEGIMEWQHSEEYDKLLSIVDPYAHRKVLDMPKLLLSATGDQFFLPDSWKFYWKDLVGEKHMRYVPNSEHSMDETDAWMTLVSFYEMILNDAPRPDFDWSVQGGVIHVKTQNEFPPSAITLWQATNPKARNFQVDSIGRAYAATSIPINAEGVYEVSVKEPSEGYTAFFAELTFPGLGDIPLKLTTGVVVTPDTYPFKPFESEKPMGTTKTQ